MIEIRNLTKLYGSVIGVNDVSVDLADGAHGLLGPNGAGKTTFLGLVTGQLRPTMGRVLVFGERPFGNPRVLRRIGYCPAADLGDRTASPREWVTYLVRLSGFTAAAAVARADAALERVGLLDAARRPLTTLSKGMRQRAKIAGAIAHAGFGDISIAVVVSLLIGQIPGVWIGARMSSRYDGHALRWLLMVVLAASALKLLGVSILIAGIIALVGVAFVSVAVSYTHLTLPTILLV